MVRLTRKRNVSGGRRKVTARKGKVSARKGKGRLSKRLSRRLARATLRKRTVKRNRKVTQKKQRGGQSRLRKMLGRLGKFGRREKAKQKTGCEIELSNAYNKNCEEVTIDKQKDGKLGITLENYEYVKKKFIRVKDIVEDGVESKAGLKEKDIILGIKFGSNVNEVGNSFVGVDFNEATDILNRIVGKYTILRKSLNIKYNISESKTSSPVRTPLSEETRYVGPSNDTPYATPEGVEHKYIALYDFDAQNDDELTFRRGDVIVITKFSDDNWGEGKLNEEVGWVPMNYVEYVSPHTTTQGLSLGTP